jgi:hypothetical protein
MVARSATLTVQKRKNEMTIVYKAAVGWRQPPPYKN